MMQSNNNLNFKNYFTFFFFAFYCHRVCSFRLERQILPRISCTLTIKKNKIGSFLLEDKLRSRIEIEFKCKVVSAEEGPGGLCGSASSIAGNLF